MRRQEAGDPIHQDIKVATGNAIAVLCKCVKQESSDAGTPESQDSGEAVEDSAQELVARAEVVQVSTTDWDRKRHRVQLLASAESTRAPSTPGPGCAG